jgi:hypothetical protein
VIELVRQGTAPVTLAPGAYEAAVLDAGGARGRRAAGDRRADVPASPSPSQADRAAAPRVAEPDASGAPRIRSFNVNTAPLGGRRSRVTFLHTTQAPICGCGAPDGGSIGFAAPGLANGGQTFPTEVLGAAYGLLVSPAPLRPGNESRSPGSS